MKTIRLLLASGFMYTIFQFWGFATPELVQAGGRYYHHHHRVYRATDNTLGVLLGAGAVGLYAISRSNDRAMVLEAVREKERTERLRIHSGLAGQTFGKDGSTHVESNEGHIAVVGSTSGSQVGGNAPGSVNYSRQPNPGYAGSEPRRSMEFNGQIGNGPVRCTDEQLRRGKVQMGTNGWLQDLNTLKRCYYDLS
ncbi:MAG: hypothetical protein Q8P07_02565 [bacterium]|nr:hypothetical protein [bacterium]